MPTAEASAYKYNVCGKIIPDLQFPGIFLEWILPVARKFQGYVYQKVDFTCVTVKEDVLIRLSACLLIGCTPQKTGGITGLLKTFQWPSPTILVDVVTEKTVIFQYFLLQADFCS